jgi:hypothetical protein
MILHEEDGTTAVFRSREQEQMIGAEVEHGGNNEREPKLPPSWQRR